MRILFLGDVVGRAGRTATIGTLPLLREALAVDFAIVNGENAAGGRGLTIAHAKSFLAAGADAITTGNWVWGQREIIGFIGKEPRLLRPHNYPRTQPGAGVALLERGAHRLFLIHLLGRVHMEPIDDPFAAAEAELAKHRLGGDVGAILIDMHGEATSEKQSLAHALDGRVSAVVGSHTHVPTADAQILPRGTAYQSDAGMCGDYDSVIGYDKQGWIERFTRKMPPAQPMDVASGAPTLCGILIETDARTGLATSIAPMRLGGRLAPAWPGTGSPPSVRMAAET